MTNPIMEMLDNQKAAQEQSNSLPTNADDPRLNPAKDYVSSHGGNAKDAFFALCRERGIDPSVILGR